MFKIYKMLFHASPREVVLKQGKLLNQCITLFIYIYNFIIMQDLTSVASHFNTVLKCTVD